MVHVAVNKYDFEKNQHFRVPGTLLGRGEGVIKKRTLCTLSKMSIIVNDPLDLFERLFPKVCSCLEMCIKWLCLVKIHCRA